MQNNHSLQQNNNKTYKTANLKYTFFKGWLIMSNAFGCSHFKNHLIAYLIR